MSSEHRLLVAAVLHVYLPPGFLPGDAMLTRYMLSWCVRLSPLQCLHDAIVATMVGAIVGATGRTSV